MPSAVTEEVAQGFGLTVGPVVGENTSIEQPSSRPMATSCKRSRKAAVTVLIDDP